MIAALTLRRNRRGMKGGYRGASFCAIATDVPAPDIAGIAESIADWGILRGGEAIAL